MTSHKDHKPRKAHDSEVDNEEALLAEAETAQAEPDPYAVLQALQTEVASLKDRNLRTLAEMENLRRRTEREVADAKIYGVANFARDMLTFNDNMTRALANVPAEVRAVADPALQSFVEGMELTQRDFLSRLARHGVKPVVAQGTKFDPNLHEVLFEIPDESQPHGTVAQVMEEGYTIGDRVLRPAKVGTSKGGPKA